MIARNAEQLVLLIEADAEPLSRPLGPRNMLVGQDEPPIPNLDERPRSPGFAVVAPVDEDRRPILRQISGHVGGELGHRRLPLFLAEEQPGFRDIRLLLSHRGHLSYGPGQPTD